MYARQDIKTQDQMFLTELNNRFGFAPIVSGSILDLVKSTFQDVSDAGVKAGQMKVLAVSADEPSGKPLKECKLVPAVITIDAGSEDTEILKKFGSVAQRQSVILRM